MKQCFLAICLLLCFSFQGSATHLVGGELTYTRIANTNSLEFTLTIYRDNYNGNPNANFDDPATISVFDDAGNFVVSFFQFLDVDETIPIELNPCQSSPPDVDTEIGQYVFTVDMPTAIPGYDPNAFYTFVYARCCRNGALVDNLLNPGESGFTSSVVVPPMNIINSSPVFNETVEQYLCEDRLNTILFTATDPDGDSLVYTFCSPFLGLGSGQGNNPPIADANDLNAQGGPPTFNGYTFYGPPFSPVMFGPGFSSNDPFGQNSSSIDPVTGIAQITPPNSGTFSMAVCVEEYRNGVLLSVISRDFQYTVSSCDFPEVDINYDPSIPQDSLTGLFTIDAQCDDGTVFFDLGVDFGITEYFWDFGVPSLTDDTANIPNPSFFYSDTGTFIVTVIGTSGDGCADTATGIVQMYPIFRPGYFLVDSCLNLPVVFTDTSFATTGFINSWSWDFGDTLTSSDTSNLQNPAYTYAEAGTYVSSLIVTTSKGCQETVYDTVVVHPLPEFAYSTSLPCEGDSINIINESMISSGSITSYEWDFDDGNGWSSTAIDPQIFLPAGTYNIQVNAISNLACRDTASLPLVINPLPNIVISPDTVICEGDAVALNVSGGQDYLWYTSPSLTGETTNQPTVNPDSLSQYVVLVTTTEGCFDEDSVEVDVAYTEANFQALDTCLNIASQFLDGSTTTEGSIEEWSWNFGDLSVLSDTSNAINTSYSYPQPGFYQVSLVIESSLGCVDSTLQSIEVLPIPNADFVFGDRCEGSPVFFVDSSTLDSGTLIAYNWSFGGQGSSLLQNPSFTFDSAGTYNVSLIATSSLFCRDTFSVPITVNSLPIVSLTADTFICGSTSLQLNAFGGVSYQWRPVSSLSNPTIATPVASPISSTTYIVEVTDGNNCVQLDSMNLGVYPAPNIDAGLDTSVCLNINLPLVFNDEVQLQATGAVAYAWIPLDGLDDGLISNPTASPDTNILYFVEGIDSNNCLGRDSVLVTVLNPALELISLSVDSTCFGDTSQVDVADQGLVSEYLWTPSAGLSDSSIRLPIFTPQVTTTYTLQVTNYCYGDLDSIRIEVLPLPLVTIPDIDSVCIDALPYELSAPPGYDSYSWITSDPSILDPTADTTFVSPSFDETYILEITDDIGSLQCLNRDTLQLEVNYLPDVTILPIGPFVCEGIPYVLDAFSDEAISYQWLSDPAIDSSQGNQAIITPIDTNWYTVIASNIHGCENSDSIFLPVQFPVSVDVVSDTALCIGSELVLNALGAETYQWFEASLDLSQDATLIYPVTGNTFITVVGSNACFDDTMIVSVTGLDLPLVTAGNDTTIFRNTQAELSGDGEGNLVWIDNPSILNPGSLIIDVEPLENTTYILSSLGGNGCENLDSVTVFVEGKNALYLPTAFSPNGDGINDLFHIIASLNITQILDFSIWNRSGGLLFSTSDINDMGWDGRFKGKEQPLGVYVWSIQALSYDGEIVSYKGNVTLTR